MLKSMRGIIGTLAFAGCVNNSGSTSQTCQALVQNQAIAAPAAQWARGSVFTIVMENKGQSDIFGNPQAPYINSLAKQYAVARGYHDPFIHPSEPNYLWMASGENFGVLDDNDPASHHIDSTSHIADQIELAGLTWKSYQESMGAPCGLVSSGRYAAKHDPFVYFDDVNGWDGVQYHPELRCAAHVVDYSQLEADVAANALPRYAFITPNLDDDMHDGTIAEGDAWLQQELPKLLATPQFTNGGVVFLMWDEGVGTFGPTDDPPFIAISPHAKPGFTSNVTYDTSSYLLTVQQILGLQQALPCTKNATTVQSMTDLFSVPLN